jgi:hypothetical protein
MTNATDTGESKPLQTLTVFTGAAFIIGVVIGIGIFRTPSLVASSVSSEALFIGVWLLGGLDHAGRRALSMPSSAARIRTPAASIIICLAHSASRSASCSHGRAAR